VKYQGLVNGDTPSSLTASPVCVARDAASKPVTPSTAPGSYTITCTGASDPNYSIDQSATATLTVLPAPTTIQPKINAISTYGRARMALQAVVASAARSCVSAARVRFVLTENPHTSTLTDYLLGTSTANALGIAKLNVSTAGWAPGAYVLDETVVPGSRACSTVTTSSTMLVTASKVFEAHGIGTYYVPGVGQVAFAMTIHTKPVGANVVGHVAVVAPGAWELLGSLNSYARAPQGSGSGTGTCHLYRWVSAIGSGTGGWQLVSGTASYSLAFRRSTSVNGAFTSLGRFGVIITATQGSGAPALPNSAPQPLLSGQVLRG